MDAVSALREQLRYGRGCFNVMSNKRKVNMDNTRQGQQPQIVQFDSNDCDRLACKECGHDGFEFEYGVIEIPYIYQAAFQGQKHMNMQYYKCTECGHRHALDELEQIGPKNKEESGLVVLK